MMKPFKDELGRSRDKKKKSLIRNGQANFDLMGCGERGKLIPGLFEIRVEDQGQRLFAVKAPLSVSSGSPTGMKR